MKKEYLVPKIIIYPLDDQDIVTTSTPDAEPDPFDLQGGLRP